MAKQFKYFMTDKSSYTPSSELVKLININTLPPQARWDIDFNWSTQERENLGVEDSSLRSIDSVIEALISTSQLLERHKNIIEQIEAGVEEWKELDIGCSEDIEIFRGNRVIGKDCKKNPGSVVVVASGRHKESYFGLVDGEWLKRKFANLDERVI